MIEDFDNEILTFKGELKDGKKYNWKTKEDYFEDSCHYNFEGVFINGIKKGKEYAEGKLIYEGEKKMKIIWIMEKTWNILKENFKMVKNGMEKANLLNIMNLEKEN